MTQRLPIPGSDNGTWGTILNGFLEVSHNADGSLQTAALVGAGAVTSVNSVTPSSGNVTLTASNVGALTESVANGLYAAAGAYAPLVTNQIVLSKQTGIDPTGVADT